MSEKRIIDNINVSSSPSDLRITDVRFLDIVGAPMRCTIMKIMTNQGIEGYGEVRDGAHRLYGEMLKSRILGENPCDIDRLFRRIKQFGGHARQGGGVCGVEIALWDIAAKAYGVPIYQMLGGKFRDKVRIYCDTDVHGRHTGKDMGKALQERIAMGFTFLKMDLGIGLLRDIPGALCAPGGFLKEQSEVFSSMRNAKTPEEKRWAGHRAYDYINIPHNFTGISITKLGLDWLENYVKEVREVIGYDLPLALDHFGHIGIDSCIQLARRLESYNIAWAEDMVPWQDTASYAKLNSQVALPVCTGEDIYLKENFLPLLKADGVQVIHPDILTCGGILELKKIGDMAQDYGVAMAIHMAESPIACLAAAHVATATENFLALEFHSVETPWWDDMVNGPTKPIINNGYITLDNKPGLGIESLNDEVLMQHLNPNNNGVWDDTSQWDDWESSDRLWS